MSSGRKHDRVAEYTSAGVFLIMHFMYRDILLAIISVGVYLLASFIFSPDLDIVSKPCNRWGYLKFIWTPYRKVIKHRSICSHTIIITDVIKILYLSVVAYIPITLITFIINGVGVKIGDYYMYIVNSINNNIQFFGVVFISIFLASFVHIVTDYISTNKKKLKRKWKKYIQTNEITHKKKCANKKVMVNSKRTKRAS